MGYYFGIFKRMFKDRNTPPYSWYYVDLFSGDGTCVCEKIEKRILDLLPEGNIQKWEPPFFSLFKYATPGNYPLKCYFNDIDMDTVKILRRNLNPYSNFVEKIENEDANKCYKYFLELIKNKNKPGMFFLDPSNHKHLNFSTIKGISEFQDAETGRKPELIINLMTFTMLKAIQRGNPKDYESITESIGTDKWQKKTKRISTKGENTGIV